MKNKIVFLIIILISIFTVPVNAKKVNAFYTGNNISIDKKVDSSTFAAGNDIDVSAKINGASFIAGNNLSLSSSQDILFAAGNNVSLKKATTKDAFLAGQSINIKKSNIRDLYAAAETIKVNSDISRNAYLAGESITINSKITGDILIVAENIYIGENALIMGTLKYPKDININIARTAQINKKKTYTRTKTKKLELKDKIYSNIMSFLSILLIGLLLLKITGNTANEIIKENNTLNDILKRILNGFLTLIIIPIVSIIALITIIGLPLGIISFVIYIILIYLSTIPATYCIGNILLKKEIKNQYLLLSVSLLSFYILRLIPVIGKLIVFISLCLGLGIFYNIIKTKIQCK